MERETHTRSKYECAYSLFPLAGIFTVMWSPALRSSISTGCNVGLPGGFSRGCKIFEVRMAKMFINT